MFPCIMENADYDISAIEKLLIRTEEDLTALKRVIQRIARFAMVASIERKRRPLSCVTTISKITGKPKHFGQGDCRESLDIKRLLNDRKAGPQELLSVISEIHHALCKAFYEIRSECNQRCDKYNTEEELHENLERNSMKFLDPASYNEQAWPCAVRCEVGKMKLRSQSLRAEMRTRTRQKKQQEDEMNVLRVTEKRVAQELQRIENRSPLLSSKIANEEVLSGCLERRLCSLLSQLTSSERALLQVQALWEATSSTRNTEKQKRSESKAQMEAGLKQIQSDLESSYVEYTNLEEKLSRTSETISTYDENISEMDSRTGFLYRQFEGMEGCQTILIQDIIQVAANKETLLRDVANRKLELEKEKTRGRRLKESLLTTVDNKKACLKNLVDSSHNISTSQLKYWEDELKRREKKIESIADEIKEVDAATKILDAQQTDLDREYDKLFENLAEVETNVNASNKAFTSKQVEYQAKLMEMKTFISTQKEIYMRQQNEMLAEESNKASLKQSVAEQEGIVRDKLKLLEQTLEETGVKNANYENILECLEEENDLLCREQVRLAKECNGTSKMYVTQYNQVQNEQLGQKENITRMSLACKSKEDATANITGAIIYTNEATETERSRCDELSKSLRPLEDKLASINREMKSISKNLDFLIEETEKKKQLQNADRAEFETFLSRQMGRIELMRTKARASVELNRELVAKYRTCRHRLVSAHARLSDALDETRPLKDIANNWMTVKKHQYTLHMEMMKYKATRRDYFLQKLNQLPPICELGVFEFMEAEEQLEQDIKNMIKPPPCDTKATQCDSCSGNCLK